jgi:pyruvate/2-oxoglutarate dehydrogenase complex dihydrolipoamide dehydrogenase (E3) component
MKAVKARKDMVSRRSRESVESWIEHMERCSVYRGHARFVSPREVQVGEDRIAAKQIFVNAGAGLSFRPCLESTLSPS